MKCLFSLGRIVSSTAFACLLVSGSDARAVEITYDLISLGGADYRYEYTVHNDGSLPGGAPVALFDILFDTTEYDEASLTVVTPAPLSSDWDELILASVFPDDPATYDAFALGGGIPSGSTDSGFAVEFSWIGAGPSPGDQPFEIYDPFSFALLSRGTTSSEVPEPFTTTSSLLLLSLFGLGLVKRFS